MNLYDATVPIFTKHLTGLNKWLDKAAAFADQKKFDPEILLQMRLAPDQYSLLKQIQAACDQAKYTTAKLAGKDPPSHPDTEKTIADVRARLKVVVDYLATFKRDDFQGAEDRPCKHAWMPAPMRGGDYLDHFSLPNFHFHLVIAYEILRHNGVDLSINDYMGDLPFLK